MDKKMKLKVGDQIIENDGICVIVYKIVKVSGKKAIGETKFEGKTYPTAYKTHQKDPENIETFISVPGDLTIRKLVRHNEHPQES